MKNIWKKITIKYGISEPKEAFLLKKIEIVIVDKNEDSLHCLKMFFESNTDYGVSTFSSPLEALNYMTNHNTQLLLTNYSMEEREGALFFKSALALHPHLNGIIMSETVDKVKTRQTLKSLKSLKGFQYLEAELDEDDLLIAMDNAVENIYLTTVLEIKTRAYQKILSDQKTIRNEIVKTFM